jgi:hypothetical protein
VDSGSQTSILIAESTVGVSVAVTRQNAGNPVRFCGGLLSGIVKTPVLMSVADVIVVCSSASVCRLVHGVAIADVLPIRTAAKPVAAPTRPSRCMVCPP